MTVETFETFTRAPVRGVTPYFPGKPIAEVQRELGIKKVIKLASNENPLGASPKAVAEVRRSLKQCHIYPEGASPLLRQALAKRLGVAPTQIIVGNGSDEVIRLLCEAFVGPEDEVIASRCGFIRFKQQAMLMGAKVIEAPMRNWTHDLESIGRAVNSRTKLIFVASPNNPTGTYNTRREVAALLDRLEGRAILVLDEAYFDYAIGLPDYPDSVREFLHVHSNLVILRTFSKAYGLAGLRVGYGVGDAKLMSWLDRVRMPFNVSLLGQRAALEALSDPAFVRKSVSLVEKNRPIVANELRRMGLKVGESAANFIFVRFPHPGREVFQRLLRQGVIIRPLDEYGLPEHARITIGLPSENKKLCSAMRAVLHSFSNHSNHDSK